jgi:hypothetical protein
MSKLAPLAFGAVPSFKKFTNALDTLSTLLKISNLNGFIDIKRCLVR